MAKRFDSNLHLDAHVRLDDSTPVNPIHRRKGIKHHMQNLNDYFIIPFADPNVALTRLLTYGARSLSRLSLNNPGNIFDNEVAATTAALNDAETCVTDVNVKLALREAKTQAKEDFRNNLPLHIRRIYGAVAGVYGDPSVEITECFPQGRSLFRDCRDEQLNNHLGQLVACLANKTVDASIKTLAQAQLTNWNAIYTAQGTAKDDVNVTAEVRAAKRAALEMQLYKNILTVALEYPGDFAKCDYYFPQQYLRRPSTSPTPEQAILTGDPFNSAARTVTLHGSSDGAESIRFERRMQGENDWSAIATVVAVDGIADHVDTLSNDGSYEYRAIGVRGAAEGAPSATLVVVAA